MGIVLRLQRHAASTEVPADAAKAAKASKVISPQPFWAATRTISGHRFEGTKPRFRHVLTVDFGKPSASERALVPPRASIAESIVTSVIPPNLVRNPRTGQEFATCETTFSPEPAGIQGMSNELAEQGRRLIETREALGFESQAEFAKEIGLAKNLYNPFEKGKRPITLRAAKAIKKRFKIGLDWTIDGDPDDLPGHLFRKLARTAA